MPAEIEATWNQAVGDQDGPRGLTGRETPPSEARESMC